MGNRRGQTLLSGWGWVDITKVEHYKKLLAVRNKWNSQRKKVKPVILKRDDKKCARCGSTRDLTIDHINPIFKGGDNSASNLQTLCRKCNCNKGAK